MTMPEPPEEPPERTFDDVLRGRIDRRRERVRAEVRRSREGAHKIPTWVLTLTLGLLVAGWIYLIATA